MKATFFVLITLVISTFIATAYAEDDIAFTDFSGRTQTIESYTGNGKWLVVMVWAHDCHVCNREAEGYAQFHEAHKDEDAAVLGVSMDGEAGKAKAEDFVARHDLSFPNLIGEPHGVMLKYMMLTESQFRGTPSVLIFAPDGSLQAAQAGAVPIASIEAFIARTAKAPASAG